MRRLSMPLRVEHVELVEQHRGVHHDAVADDRHDPRIEDAARHELQLEHLAVHDERVAGVVPALIADAQRSFLGEVVGEPTLALVAPLGPDDYRPRHAALLMSVRAHVGYRLVGAPRGRAGRVSSRRGPCGGTPSRQVTRRR